MGTRLNLLNAARSLWHSIRELSGDDGYERYLQHHAAAHPDTPPLSRIDWFAHEQQQKWTGVKRCC
ncbi:MAG: YbdD/YjiX family protein [Gallionella sp.]|nr:YbdD/YjiX family protein [Gallionella sp.]